MKNQITIKGARQHNLKDINVTLPKEKLVVITGLSGSGKSSLAFDTIYAEGQRRYVESLSAYARQFLGMMQKPDVDSIEGLSPAISIEQKTTSKNPRSTVGTVTEVYDYLRLLYARVGVPYSKKTGLPLEKLTTDQIVDIVFEDFKDKKLQILAPIITQKKGTHEKLIKDLEKEGYRRVLVNDQIYMTDEEIKLDRYKKHDIYAVVDRIKVSDRQRLAEGIENACTKSKGSVVVYDEDKNKHFYATSFGSIEEGVFFDEIEPRMFSFNSPFGACQDCHGLGISQNFDPELLIDEDLSIADGAIKCYGAMDGYRLKKIGAVGNHFKFDLFTPFKDLKKAHQKIILYGTEKEFTFDYTSKDGSSSYKWKGTFEGVIPEQARLYHQTTSDYRRRELEKYMSVKPCPTCNGKRLKDEILQIKIDGQNIIDITDMSIRESLKFFKDLKFPKHKQEIAKHVLKEIIDRLTFLNNVGLSYLTMSRSAGTLSGGESQRIRLATQIGSNLTGVLYVLDEPSIGLHQRDNDKLIETLHRLRDLGNTLIVVEHDEDTILNADYVVDIGPGAGEHGGKVMAVGTPKQIMANKKSLTGQYLIGNKKIEVPKVRRKPDGHIKVFGASQNNLKNINVNFPTNVLCCITGVSGSGKSSLVNSILYKGLHRQMFDSGDLPGKHKKIELSKDVDKVIVIDQSPIGKTPRSNPSTYTKLFDDIRDLFANTNESKIRGYKTGRFSFNVRGGRCENCEGDGVIKIEMNFLPDVYVECEVCHGKRYNKETLEVKYKGKTIADVLAMSVDEALVFFENHPKIMRKLQMLSDVGLGYIRLGQSSTTLSGGESQRIKLTRELAKRSLGHTLYILDEPTTGLHFEDVKKLLDVLNRLVDKENSILVIEHNLEVIKSSDYIIDLGPEGGDEGGMIVCEGTPEEVVKNKKSYTAKYLKRELTK